MCVHLCCQLFRQEEPIASMLPNKALTSSSQVKLKDKLLTETIYYGSWLTLTDSAWLCLSQDYVPEDSKDQLSHTACPSQH